MTTTLPFSDPAMHLAMTSAVKDWAKPKAVVEMATPVSPMMRTGRRPIRSLRRPQDKMVANVQKANNDSCAGQREISIWRVTSTLRRPERASETDDRSGVEAELCRVVRDANTPQLIVDEGEGQQKSDRFAEAAQTEYKDLLEGLSTMCKELVSISDIKTQRAQDSPRACDSTARSSRRSAAAVLPPLAVQEFAETADYASLGVA